MKSLSQKSLSPSRNSLSRIPASIRRAAGLVLAVASLAAVGCGSAGEEVVGDDGVVGDAFALDGFYPSRIAMDVTATDTEATTAPSVVSCAEDIDLEVVEGVLEFDGNCVLPASNVAFVIDATVAEDGSVDGTIELTLVGQAPFTVDLLGAIDEAGVFVALFDDVLESGRFDIRFDGSIDGADEDAVGAVEDDAFDGDYEAAVEIDLGVDFRGSFTAIRCIGEMKIAVVESAIAADGFCLNEGVASAVDIAIDAEVGAAGEIDGTITLALTNNTEVSVDFEGRIQGGAIFASFLAVDDNGVRSIRYDGELRPVLE